eukprot:CAMPEP_0119131932 /NCGR_PEP_ID=MMETSP1310-20130426/10962_1 /TAXON_ID=464262 /ORGANISM="Genus nov. species nov., Strain RCC2339" /LENGTH=200 /DNA_ID=CAMNT_0007122529 /DNA_START=128 /DNA_END=730 /DNA_ORIENTATION=-
MTQMSPDTSMPADMMRDVGSAGPFPHQHFASVMNSDISLGAYLLQSLCCHCENCGSTNTPQWRKGWYSKVLGKHVLLCNACGLKYSKNQFCPYCYFVYSRSSKNKHDDREAGRQWLSCQRCQRWVHLDCEQRYGDHEGRIDKQKYVCPSCEVSSGPVPMDEDPPACPNLGLSQSAETRPRHLYKSDDDEGFRLSPSTASI